MNDKRVDLLFTLYFIGRKVKGHYKEENKDRMLSSAILHILQDKDHTLSELAKILYSKLSALSEKISGMEKEGLVKKREQSISLTPLGKKRIEKMLDEMKLHCISFIPTIAEEDLRITNAVLQKIAQSK